MDMIQSVNDGDVDKFLAVLQTGMSINAIDENGSSVFHYACGRGHVDIVQACIEHGADLSEENGATTALSLAVKNSHTEVVKLLIEEGCDVNGIDSHGHTSLHTACREGQLEVAQVLLEHNAEVHAIDKMGCTALHCAAKSGHLKVVELLINVRLAHACMHAPTKAHVLRAHAHAHTLAHTLAHIQTCSYTTTCEHLLQKDT